MKPYIFFIIPLIFLGCNSGKDSSEANGPVGPGQDTIRIASCFSCERLTNKWAGEYQKSHPEIYFDILVDESSSCIAALNGPSRIAVISRELLPEEDSLHYCISSVAKHGVVLIVNEENPYTDILKKGVDKATIIEMYETSSWYPLARENQYPLNIYYRTIRAGNTFNLMNFLNMDPSKLSGKPVDSDIDMVEAIRSDRFGLGYCSNINAYDIETNAQARGIRVLPIRDYPVLTPLFYDSLHLMKRAIWTGKYQFHLHPTLYVVMKEKPPDPATRSFLKWIFTTGQQVVEKEGYIQLRQSEIGCRIKDLDALGGK